MDWNDYDDLREFRGKVSLILSVIACSISIIALLTRLLK